MMDEENDWKSKLGFKINFSPARNSDDDFDAADVVFRRHRQSDRLLADGGDGAEADLLSTTPPRTTRRNKGKRKTLIELGQSRRASGSVTPPEQTFSLGAVADRHRKRSSVKIRAMERSRKQELAQREGRADSLPAAAVPTLVESCNRFMCLSSRLKCRADEPGDGRGDEQEGDEEGDKGTEARAVPASRVSFHKTFSMLINMGNIDKGCRRTISREEQVWQSERKDLIWLELQARVAGRSPAAQDAFLCRQRRLVPALVHDIRDYRFVNPNPCRGQPAVVGGSREDLAEDGDSTADGTDSDDGGLCCVSPQCLSCSTAVGKALRELGLLLDKYYAATTLYPSCKAMTADHPLVATQLFQNRLKAMCLWYNTALHMRLKVLAVRRMLRTLRLKNARRGVQTLPSCESDFSRQSSENHRPCAVRFNVNSATPSDSNNSDSSGHSEAKDDPEKYSETEEGGTRGVDKGGGKSGATIEETGVNSSTDKGSMGAEEIGVNRNDTLGESGGKEAAEIEKKTEEQISEKSGDADVVDSGEKRSAHSGQATPEIIISDNKYGTSDTTASSESGYDTTRSLEGEQRDTDDVYDLGSLDDMTELRLLNKCAVSPYRSYHYEILKTQGIRRCMMFVNKLRTNLLHKVHLTLEKPDHACGSSEKLADVPAEVFEDAREVDDRTESKQDEDEQRAYELRRYGCWSEECLAMRLPSYRNHFLLLSSICMEAVHDYLEMRLEDQPRNPSCLTVKQLIHELKEGLDIATQMRSAFARNVHAALGGQRGARVARRDLLLLVRTFDATVETVLKQYLSYVRTMSLVEHMPRAALQAEWAFVARLARRARCAKDLAPMAFSEIACNQLDRVVKQFEDKFKPLTEAAANAPDPDRYSWLSWKRIVYALCREAQSVYAGEREAALQAAQGARALANRLARAPIPAYTPQRQRILDSLMAVRDCVVAHCQLIEERADAGVSAELAREPDAVLARVRELLLQVYRLGFELHKELYQFAQAPFQLVDEKVQRRTRPASLQPPRSPALGLRKRPETVLVHDSVNPVAIHKELHRFVTEPRPVARRAPSRLRVTRADSVDDGDSGVVDDRLFDTISQFGEGQTHNSIEVLLTGVEPRPEEVGLRKDQAAVSDEERQWANRVARAIVEFARCWMRFVVQRCDTGRGLRPRWASQGLEFLMLACDPCNTQHLTEEEFEELKKEMDGCISHVVGSRPVARTADKPPRDPPRRRPSPHPRPSPGVDAVPAGVPAPPTPPCEPDPLLSFHCIENHEHSRRVAAAVQRVDLSRDGELRGRQAVGRVLGAVASYQPKLRQLTFKWQRGLKIGAGTFGKVYTVVNTESGQLLAMKELSVAAGDRRALQRAANELRVLEGVLHPHLVRYYGCELHREEMLLFMELCVEGSLEALVATSGALAEQTVRRYAKQLLSAVAELHSRSIAHRDIKSGNIFLTNEGHCLKLGDFGCAVKIRANTTAAGELQGHVGTQAYMAPEVFMKSSGHGRKADIWSLGCVVTEMASGKRPFSEYDSNYQIMFVVGMGGRPRVPEALSEEGRAFCLACLTHEPEERPTAEALGLHHFLMVKSDEDCNCQPGHLIT